MTDLTAWQAVKKAEMAALQESMKQAYNLLPNKDTNENEK